MAKVNARGIDLGVSRYSRGDGQPGERPVVVLIHGLGIGDRTNLSFTLGVPLAAETDVIAYDLRGHGWSELTPAGYRLADHVEDLVALLDALGVSTPVHLVTHSYGGAIALLAAMTYPDRVASACLIEGVFPFDGWGEEVVKPLRKAAEGLRRVRDREEMVDKVLVPLTIDMVGPVRSAIDAFDPHVVVTDQRAYAGGIVAIERGLTWAVSASTTAELLDPVAFMPKLRDWMQRKLHELYARLGMPELAENGFDPRFSPHLVLEYSTPALVGDVGRDLPSVAFVGPIVTRDLDPEPFPWEWLDRHEANILVSLGTVSAGIGDRFLTAVMEAVAGKPYGVVMVGQPGSLPTPPENMLVLPSVPQVELLTRMKAVVCHGGHNTVCESLALGVPLVCAPIRDDQPIVTQQVVQAGVGLRVKFARARPADIAAAIHTLLGDVSYEMRASRIALSFYNAGGVPTAADHLEKLLPDDG